MILVTNYYFKKGRELLWKTIIMKCVHLKKGASHVKTLVKTKKML